MGKSIRSKIKKKHRSIKRREEGPVERRKRALQAVALGALPVEKAPEDPGVPNQPSSGPKRFTFNKHLSKPPPPLIPANLRPKVDGITVGKPNGNPRLFKLSKLSKPKPEETKMDTEDGDKDPRRKAWRAVLRQRIKKKKRSRKANGWSEVPSVLCAGGIDSITYDES